jgi:phasin family protein
MTSLSEQLSAARQSQIETQLNFLQSVTSQAFASAQQVLALNLRTSRSSVERSSQAVKQLFEISDPRDLLSLTSHTQEQLESMIAYGRELFSIAAGARLALQDEAPALPTPAAAPVDPAPAPVAVAVAAAEPVQAEPAPVVVAEASAEPEPVAEVAKAKPIAKAVSKVAAKPAVTEHPAAANVQQEIEIPTLKAVEAAPAKQADAPAAKGSRRK